MYCKTWMHITKLRHWKSSLFIFSSKLFFCERRPSRLKNWREQFDSPDMIYFFHSLWDSKYVNGIRIYLCHLATLGAASWDVQGNICAREQKKKKKTAGKNCCKKALFPSLCSLLQIVLAWSDRSSTSRTPPWLYPHSRVDSLEEDAAQHPTSFIPPAKTWAKTPLTPSDLAFFMNAYFSSSVHTPIYNPLLEIPRLPEASVIIGFIEDGAERWMCLLQVRSC